MSTHSSDSSFLNAKNLQKYFPVETGIFAQLFGDEEYVKAVDGVDITIDRQEVVGLVGESGCGKSTLGRTLVGLHEPTGGSVEFKDRKLDDYINNDPRALRRDVQVIFQDPMASLNPRKTAGEIIGKPLEVHDIATGDEKEERVGELLEEVGLQRSHRPRYPHEFSGGQRQRIGIARALAVEPELIIADEPVSSLDVSVQAQIINLMKRLQQKYELSYLFIAHDLSVVKHISDRVAVMYLGKIVEQGPKKAIFQNPQHPYTRALLKSIPRVDVDQPARENILEGNPPSPINPPSGCSFHTRCPEYIGNECTEDIPELDSVEDASGAIRFTDNERDEDLYDDAQSEHIAACHWLSKESDQRRQNLEQEAEEAFTD